MESSTRKRFDPNDHMMIISRKQRQPDGSYKQIDNKYLQVKDRIVWFRDENPSGQIVTELLSPAGTEPAVVRATATYTHENGEQAVGVGMGQADTKKWGDYLEKAETRAIGRALAMLGYGTQFAPEFDEEDLVADAPVESRNRTESRQPEPQNSPKTEAAPQGIQFASSYKPHEKSDDLDADVEALATRMGAARTLSGVASVHKNAEEIGVAASPEYKTALMSRIEKFIEDADAPDKLKQLGGYTEFLGLKGDKYLTEVYTAKMESFRGK